MSKFLQALFPLIVSCHVYAIPLSHTSTVAAETYYIPLVVLSVSLFLLLVAIKLVYMKQRRIGTIHTPLGIPRSSSLGLRDKGTNRQHGLLVGCLGSPAWETNLTARLNRTAWQRRSSLVRRDTISTMRSTRTKSTDANQFILPLSSARSRVASTRSGSSSKLLGSARRNTSIHYCHPRCGDFGESRGLGLPGNSLRRVSPCSIRLVDGPGHSSQVEYAFLSGHPPDAFVASPLMNARDSIQLSQCSLRGERKPAPPLPPLPSFLALEPETDAEQSGEGGYLPDLQFSPLVNVSKAAEGKWGPSSRSFNLDDAPMSSKFPHKSFASTAPLCLVQQTNFLVMSPDGAIGSRVVSRHDGVDLKKPLKSCLRQNSVCSSALASTSDTTTRTRTLTDQTSPRTPISDDDIGILGLDRFRLNDEVKEKSSHMKKDSIAWVPYWQ